MPPRRLKPTRVSQLPDWLEDGGMARLMHRPTDCVDPGSAWGACGAEAVNWLEAHGLEAEDYDRLCVAYDQARADGKPPERAFKLALKRL